MITIGENLKFTRFDVMEFDSSEIKLVSQSNELKTVATSEVTKVELIGVKNNSGYSGTMEWGMKNPTFLLPTNFCYTILNWFKRQEDDVYYKMTMVGEEPFVVHSSKKIYKEICSIIKP
ncbi:hypothetical protein [Desulforhopalus sp. 52FAK]